MNRIARIAAIIAQGNNVYRLLTQTIAAGLTVSRGPFSFVYIPDGETVTIESTGTLVIA